MLGEVVREFDIFFKNVFSDLNLVVMLLDDLCAFFVKSFNFFVAVTKGGDLYHYGRFFVYHPNFFRGIVRVFLYNGRRFVWLRQLTENHAFIRLGEMSLTKRLGRGIHIKVVGKRKRGALRSGSA